MADTKAIFIVTLVLMSVGVIPVKGDVTAVNQCSFDLTVFYQSQGSSLTSLSVAAGSSVALGLPSPWVGGVIWGSPNGNTDNGQCTQLEFNIDSSGIDYYDISCVNAYNEPVEITPTSIAGGESANGLQCGSPICSIPLPLTSNVCVSTSDNVIAGPDGACINTDGPGTVNTSNIQLFRNACPDAYVQSNDNTNVVYACDTGTDYNAIWCPS